MAWVSVNRNDEEVISEGCPGDWSELDWVYIEPIVYLPKGSIKKLIGRKLTHKDKPVELK